MASSSLIESYQVVAMPISLPCPGCKARLKAPDEAVGRTLTCPGCKTPVKIQLAAPPSTAVRQDPPVKARPPADEVFDDFEVLEDEADGLEEVLPVEDEENLDDLEEVPEDEEDLEEVEPDDVVVADGPDLGWSRLLQLPLIHVKGHTGSLLDGITRMDNAGYDLINPDSRKLVGVAMEVRDSTATALRVLVGRNFMDTRVEIREGRDEELLCTIRRPPYLWNSMLEILDAGEEVLGQFERSPWSLLAQKPVWITTKGGRKIQRLQPKFFHGRCTFLTRGGREVGEMMTEAYYERKMKIKWCPRGGSYYVTFKRALEDRPLERLLFLAAGLGIDLFATEAMSRRR